MCFTLEKLLNSSDLEFHMYKTKRSVIINLLCITITFGKWKIHVFNSTPKNSYLVDLEKCFSTSDCQHMGIICFGGCPMHCKMFSSMCSLYTLDIGNNPLVPLTPPSWSNQKHLQTLPDVHWGQIHPVLRTVFSKVRSKNLPLFY